MTSAPLRNFPPPCSNLGWLAQQEKRWVVATVVLLREHMLEVEVSRKGLGGSSSWGYRCFHMERLLVAYFDPLCLPAVASNPSLREQLDSALMGDQWIGN